MLGESWSIDQEAGRFVERAADSYGLLIDKKDVVSVELEWSEVVRYLNEAKDQREFQENPVAGRGAKGARDAAAHADDACALP